ncbi:heme peroxidase family protein [Nocardioides sp. HM23]|uniref:peroxidase family protein n=1 Tax=Nocardioides bizhenqiangii TaxID=3095076 RepID=UPI002ACA28B5|nr:heme peroxidase family protein [Nocardioides sp. HM23]MDZ5619410.1 heme peroxidase family protein [Nocardioides sp. HM23]
MPDGTRGQRERGHGQEQYVIEGEGSVGADRAVSAAEAAPPFRFSRVGPRGKRLDSRVRSKVARAMTTGRQRDGRIPAGYTYLGQFVDHDLTFDATTVALGENITPADLLQGRSPTLDLDSLYGFGPDDEVSQKFYADDRTHLEVGTTTRIGNLVAREGFDVPRVGTGTRPRRANIPDPRNDENLAVAQHHAAFIRFHNRVVDKLPASVPAADRFQRARRVVVLHYQWMLKTDYLPRIVDPAIVTDVFTNGRRVFEVGADPFAMPTMPVEFSVGAFRLGHSMIRESYDWNAEFPDGAGSLFLLFDFSRTSGTLGGFPTLPSNWIADWRRLYRFSQIDRPDLDPPAGEFNNARRIDTALVDPLADLPLGSFGGEDGDAGTLRANLAFRNLTRAAMLRLASGQQLADFMTARGVPIAKLTADQIRDGLNGADLSALTPAQLTAFLTDTPLWFYVLREAELNNGRLTGVGGRLVVETFHRAMEGSRNSIVRNPAWRPRIGPVAERFGMVDLLVFAFQNKKSLLAPLGD